MTVWVQLNLLRVNGYNFYAMSGLQPTLSPLGPTRRPSSYPLPFATILVGFALLLLFMLPVTGSAQLLQSQLIPVGQITITGNALIPDEEIKARVTFREGDTITQARIRDTLQRILDLGTLKSVNAELEPLPSGRVEVVFIVEENPVIEEIVFSGNTLLNRKRLVEILGESSVQVGEILNINELRSGLGAILQVYQQEGYILIDIPTDAIKLESHLEIEIVEMKIEAIEPQGLETIPEEIAIQLVSIPLNKPVRLTDVQQTFQNINRSVYFEPVRLEDFQVAPGSDRDRVRLVLQLRERRIIDAPQPIGEAIFSGNTVFSDEQLEGRLKLPEGEVDNFGLLQGLQAVVDLYHRNGYTLMDLSGTHVEGEQLEIEIFEGRIDAIVIRGNELTKDYVIAQEIQLQPGQVFNQTPLRVTFLRLIQLGYFDDVLLNYELNPAGDGGDLVVTVVERERLGSLSGGLSFSTSTGLVGNLQLARKNLLGTGQDIAFNFENGLSQGEGDSRLLTNYELQYDTRGLLGRNLSFSGVLFQQATEDVNNGTITTTQGGRVSVGFPLETFRLSVGGRAETFVEETTGTQTNGNTVALNLGAVHDTRNSPFFPTQGGQQTLLIEPGILTEDSTRTEFTKYQAILIQFFPTGLDQTFGVRLWGGWGQSLPDDERFFFGGSQSVRGIRPISRVSQMLIANPEYRVQFQQGFSGALFVDLGYALESEISGIQPRCSTSLVCSTGLGLRFDTPLGVLRFDFVWPYDITTGFGAMVVEFGIGQMF
ncbi:MAG: outer membrane protein assembly factor [Candidatus Bipolaricaulia bacterium]